MQQTPVSKSLSWIKGSCFDIRLEYNKDFMILHLPYIERMTKEVYIEMTFLLEDWWAFFKTVGYTGIHAAIDPNDVKTAKLVKMLKFDYVGTSNGADVYLFEE